eukprot:764682-Hanusia_phi.AAC.2
MHRHSVGASGSLAARGCWQSLPRGAPCLWGDVLKAPLPISAHESFIPLGATMVTKHVEVDLTPQGPVTDQVGSAPDGDKTLIPNHK